MIRRFGGPPDPGCIYRHRPGAYAILERDGLLLVTRQDADPPEYQLPGGGLEPGEQPLPALYREIVEETGWRARLHRKLGVFRRFTYMPDYGFHAEKLCHIYLGRPVIRLGPPGEADHQAIWMTPQEAASRLTVGGDRHFVRRYLCP